MVYVQQLWLQNFRNYSEANLSISPGQILVVGDNGQGKSNLLEAIGYLGTAKSFRGIPADALIKQDCDNAIIRAEVSHTGRDLLVEVEISRTHQNKIFVNKQKISPLRNLIGMIPTTIFGPDDLDLIKNGPSVRRAYLDDLLVQLHPKNIQLRADLEQVLKQRNALLKQARGRLTDDIAVTLEVWNDKFHHLSHQWGKARQKIVNDINSFAADSYMELAGVPSPLKLIYDPEWLEHGLLEVLKLQEKDELRRGTSLVGPHRDEITITLSGLPARTHASQGEQRTIALSLRIAGHELLKETHNTNPLLLLDDVFSELDMKRAKRLLKLLVADQTFISTAIAPEETSEGTQIYINKGQIL